MNRFAYGALVRVTITFESATGAAVDPAVVKAQVRNPQSQITTYTYGVDAELTKSAAGIYVIDVDANQAGAWFVRGYSTGSGQAAEESGFIVEESVFD